jgi:hypothetical protein
VPRPLSATFDTDPPTITMSVVPGKPLGSFPTAPQLRALAVAIEQLWAVPHDDITAVSSWTDDLDFGRRLTSGPRPDGGLPAAAHDAACAWWDGPDPALLRTPPEATVLGHGDPNLTNYLWDQQRIRIVDLEDARPSDPATELAILAEHISARQLDSATLCARFNVDPLRYRASRRLWAMYWLWSLLPGGPAQKRNSHGTADAQAGRLLKLLRE